MPTISLMATVSPFIDSMVEVEKELSERYGPFSLFALFQRDNGRRKYDVVIAASWFPVQWSLADMERVIAPIQAHLPKKGSSEFSHLAPVQPYEEGVLEIHRLVQTVHDPVEFWNRPFFDKDIRHAVIITSQPID